MRGSSRPFQSLDHYQLSTNNSQLFALRPLHRNVPCALPPGCSRISANNGFPFFALHFSALHFFVLRFPPFALLVAMSCALPPGCSRISASKIIHDAERRATVNHQLTTLCSRLSALRPLLSLSPCPARFHPAARASRLTFRSVDGAQSPVFGYALFHTQQPTYRGEIDGIEANIIFGG